MIELTGWRLMPLVATPEMLEASWRTVFTATPEQRMAAELGTARSAHIVKAGLRWTAMAEASPLSPLVEKIQAEAIAQMINTPELADFAKGVVLEGAHQRQRWGADHDAGKEPADWFWLIGYLAQKALMAQIAGDLDKARHHTISTAAALANWHAALNGDDTSMRPGVSVIA